MHGRLIAGLALAAWLAVGLLLTLRPVTPAPGQVVNDNFILLRTIAIYLANLDSAFWVGQFVGNLLLLLPIGLLGPIVVPALNGWLRVLGASIGISLMIEVIQLGIPNRSADIDDLLLNVAGAMLGYGILVAFRPGPRSRRALAEPD